MVRLAWEAASALVLKQREHLLLFAAMDQVAAPRAIGLTLRQDDSRLVLHVCLLAR
jgi:hypothetical protein